MAKYALILILFAQSALAEPVKLKVFSATSLSHRIDSAIIAQAAMRFKGIGVKIKVASYRKIRDHFPQYSALSQVKYRFSIWQSYMAKKLWGTLKHNEIVVVLLNPAYGNGGLYVAGVANSVCGIHHRFPFLVVNILEFRSSGRPGVPFSGIALTHELGHIVGANHVNDQSIMDYGALAYSDIHPVNFSAVSVDEIKKCLG